jgi:hypothetical protein
MRSVVVIAFGMGVIATVPVACGGVTADRGSSGGTGNAGSGATWPGLPGAACTNKYDCNNSSLEILCPDAKYSFPNTSECIGGRCVNTDPHPCSFGSSGGSTGSRGQTGMSSGGIGVRDSGVADASTASLGTVSIRFDVVGPHCYQGCVNPFIEIDDSTGHPLDFSNWCTLDSSTCSASSCPPVPCLRDSVVTMGSLDWDGGYYATASSCGSEACKQKTYAKPGT